MLCGLGVGHAQSASEYQVKAAYLYNFAKSAEWTEQSLPNGAPLVIGVVGGDDEFIETLRKTVARRTVGTHAIDAKRADSIAEMELCQLIFFRSSAGRKRTEAAMVAMASARILLVGEDDGFLRQGGMINLVLKNGTVRFEVDRMALDRASVRLSPELLALALGNSEHAPSEAASGESRRLKTSAPPEYPELARRMNIKGIVQVEASVRRDGTVKEVKVIGGHPLLADALVKAVMGWQYEPAGKESQVVVRFVFGQ
jgi:TonB family protein